MQRRHTEFFGPDLIRAPVLSGSPEVAAVQIAAAVAQLRAPLTRDLAALEQHTDLIRNLADRLFPDYASGLALAVEDESANVVTTSICVQTPHATVLRCWLADAGAEAPTTTPPNAVEFLSGTILEEITPRTSYVILTPASGIITVRVTKPGTADYRWGATILGRARFSPTLQFRRGT